MDREFLLKPFEVSVRGFPPYLYYAASRGKALATAWGNYTSTFDQVTFKDFLRMAQARRGEAGPRFGEKITVAGHPAFRVGEHGQYVSFVRPGSDQILLSHPADVGP